MTPDVKQLLIMLVAEQITAVAKAPPSGKAAEQQRASSFMIQIKKLFCVKQRLVFLLFIEMLSSCIISIISSTNTIMTAFTDPFCVIS